MLKPYRSLAIGLTLMALTSASSGAHAADRANWFEGRAMTIDVSLPPGGSYDAYARLLSRHLGEHLPGKPSSIVVRNMPGGGGVVLANYLSAVAPADGSEFGILESGVPFAPIFRGLAVKYDPRKLQWLGNLSSVVPMVIARADLHFKDASDLMTRELKVGASGAGSDTAGYPLILNSVLGTKLKVIPGYPGAPDMILAIERGELDGYSAWCWDCMKAQKPDWIKSGFVDILMQLSMKGDPELNARGVPTVERFIKTDRQRLVISTALAGAQLARPFVAPPNVPPERLQELRTAIEQTVSDPKFLEDAQRSQLPISFTKPEEMQKVIAEAYTVDEEAIATIRAAWTSLLR